MRITDITLERLRLALDPALPVAGDPTPRPAFDATIVRVHNRLRRAGRVAGRLAPNAAVNAPRLPTVGRGVTVRIGPDAVVVESVGDGPVDLDFAAGRVS
ncbi:hypothetical protein [Pseudonocardia xishanensis]|uniref:Uncharacterized protein n=1 Tax=Pseudonocardia xishanensis TaxID=630995 RepID=A0ABP8RWX7_9PSEU